MPARLITRTNECLPWQKSVGAAESTLDKVAPYLVGHTVEEVERELIIHTLAHHCGSRTRSARMLGISIRCIRNKIHAYEDQGITVSAPGEAHVRVQH
jgi:two-component system, response regulator FlrC